MVELVVDGVAATEMSLNGAALMERPSRAALDAAGEGWVNAGPNLVVARSPRADVYGPAQTFAFALAPVAATTSVSFVCDRGVTVPGESVYVTSSLPALGGWDPALAVRLSPNIYFDYIVEPPAQAGPGPSAPVWTGVVAGLPPGTAFEWKCLRWREDGTGAPDWQPGEDNRHATSDKGYSGRSYGAF